jgi:hypothetical protein
MPFSRRDLIRSGAAGLASAAVVGTASAQENWSYEPVAAAPVPGATDTALQGKWAFTANFAGLATWNLDDPASPTFGGYAPGEFRTRDNRDVKVDGNVASIADNADTPGGVTFFDVSEPASPKQVAFYDAETDVHNHFIDGDYAYLVLDDGMAVVNIKNVTEGTEPERKTKWRLRDFRPDLAEETRDNLHDIYVQDDYCYLAYWDAGVIVLDVTEPSEPRPVAHFGAYDGEDLAQGGNPQNVHYVQPTPDREFTIAGAETFGLPPHGGTAIYHTPTLADHEPDELDSIEPLAGEVDNEGEGRNPRTKTARADPYHPRPVDWVRAPDNPQDAVRTAHNSDLTDDKMFTAWYQSGIRAYDFQAIRDDPENGEFTEIAAWDLPGGDFFWSAENLESAMTEGETYYTIGSDTGKGLHVLELSSGGGGLAPI